MTDPSEMRSPWEFDYNHDFYYFGSNLIFGFYDALIVMDTRDWEVKLTLRFADRYGVEAIQWMEATNTAIVKSAGNLMYLNLDMYTVQASKGLTYWTRPWDDVKSFLLGKSDQNS